MARSNSKPPEIVSLAPSVQPDAPVAPVDERAPKKRRRGQPTRCTPAITKIVCDVVRKGNYRTVAAKAAGISTDALNDWQHRAESGEEPYATFVAELEQADRECEAALVAKVMAATDDDWRAAAMMLERKYPERWGRMREQEYPGTAAFQITIHLSNEETETIEIPRVVKFSLPAPNGDE